MPPYRMINEFTDIAGNYLRSINWAANATGMAAIQAALQAATNGNLQYSTYGLPGIGVVSPSDAQYPLVQDMAVFNFQTIPGSGLQVVVPAPLASIFMPNALAVDPLAAPSAALIAAVIGHLADVVGNPATAFIAGSKVSRRTEQVGG